MMLFEAAIVLVPEVSVGVDEVCFGVKSLTPDDVDVEEGMVLYMRGLAGSSSEGVDCEEFGCLLCRPP